MTKSVMGTDGLRHLLLGVECESQWLPSVADELHAKASTRVLIRMA